MSGPILIMAGGTGGHVFPALAVADALRGRDTDVVWLGTARGIEADLVPDEGIDLELVRVSGLRGKGIFTWLLAPFRLLVAVFDAARVLLRHRPQAVLGMGGFASGPGGLAAWLTRRPLVIHEQNSVAGLTNRLLAGIAREVLEAFPGSFSGDVKTRTVGNPVRPDILGLPAPAVRLAGRDGPLRLLVLGGSQGALALNEIVAKAVVLLPEDARPEIWHQAGKHTKHRAEAAYAIANLDVRIDAFIDDMAQAYAWADLVLCRAGALTISELTAAGLAAVLVPYPSAVDDHQTRNAHFLIDADAAVLIPQDELTPAGLAAEIERCARDRQLVLQRAERARALAQPAATEAVARACVEAGGGAW
ncbi:MAG: undecaprenyldiphospho-muramoylpentapeptide beta-N-acetylglucosaminyltransferase [Gammaproteobacteria bacterium]|nr:undecaprenyldiphospho-muramoylpentapeptide beta-N-acetylglucosaminyltransferase [Gammaproteobacteria bacterium]